MKMELQYYIMVDVATHTYLLQTDLEGRTVSYGPSIFLSIYGLGQHFQNLSHSFSLYGPSSWSITYISLRTSKAKRVDLKSLSDS